MFYDVLTGIHDNKNAFKSFADVSEVIDKYLKRTAKSEPFRVYFKNAVILVFGMLSIGGGVAYGVYMLAKMILV